jgi:flagellar biosynthesis GTPase FlhF
MSEKIDENGNPIIDDKDPVLEGFKQSHLAKRLQQVRDAELTKTKAAEEKAAELERKLQVLENVQKTKDAGNKTAEQLLAERQKEWETREKSYADKLAEEKRLRDEYAARVAQRDLDAQLRTLLTDAVNPEIAFIYAREKLGKSLKINENGEMVHIDAAGVERVGADAHKMVADWWSGIADLRRAGPAGPGTRGGNTPPRTAPAPYKLGSGLAAAAAADRAKKKK